MGEGYEYILEKALEERPLSAGELETLIGLAEPEEKERLYGAAREMRRMKGGNLIYSYGFVYLSTVCRNDCLFCAWRKSNASSPRYRKTREEVVKAALSLAGQGVSLIDLTTGEDPETDDAGYLREAAGLIAEVREASGVPVMISPGLVPREALRLFKDAGALFYACYQETHSPELFSRLRLGQSYERRWDIKKEARREGLLVEDGVLCGVGETPSDLARSILSMRELGAEQVRAMAFVPFEGEGAASGTPGKLARDRELSMTAVLRLSFPKALIPASLDVEGLSGLRPRLDAGANLVTSFVPSSLGLAGVAQGSLDIENEARSVPAALPVLEGLGLRMADPWEYMEKAGELLWHSA